MQKKRPYMLSNGPMLRILTKEVMMADHKIKNKTGHLLMFLTLSSLKTATAVERIFPFIPENR